MDAMWTSTVVAVLSSVAALVLGSRQRLAARRRQFRRL